MRVTNRVMSLLAIGMVGIGTTAGAQNVDYFTTGQFTSGFGAGCNTANAASVTCTAGELTLLFTGVIVPPPVGGAAPPTDIQLGTFTLTSTGTSTINLGTSPGVIFSLMVTQSTPSGGTATTSGNITGSFSGNNSQLHWNPLPSTMTIGNVTYELEFDTHGPGAPNGVGIPLGPQTKTINAFLEETTATPEPGSIALFATGLAGLIPVVIRRRKSSK